MENDIFEELTSTPSASPTPWIQGALGEYIGEIREDYQVINSNQVTIIDHLYLIASFTGVLVIFELMRFVKGLFKEEK